MSIEISLFGPPIVKIEHRKIAEYRFRKPFAILCYLIVEKEAISRLKLASLLWPEHNESRALTNVRKSLSILRREVGDYIITNYHEVTFNHSLPIKYDLDLLKSPIETAADVDALCDLFRDDFMAGFYVRHAPPFDTWLSFRRAHFLRQTLKKLEQTASEMDRLGRYEQAIKLGQGCVRIDPARESAHRRLMHWYFQAGQRESALKQFDICHTALKEELGIDPDPETKALYRSIRENRPLEAVKTPLTRSKLSSLKEETGQRPQTMSDFCGRESEWERLVHIVNNGTQGDGRIHFIVGEAGQGKTRLMQEVAIYSQARHQNLLVLVGHNNTFSSVGDTYLPFREILTQLVGEENSIWRTGHHNPAYLERLQRFAPQNSGQLISLGEQLFHTFIHPSKIFNQPRLLESLSAELGEQLAKVRQPSPNPNIHPEQLFSQLTSVLQNISLQSPLLLIIDDLQWADPASIDLLFHLGRRVQGFPMTLLCAFRPEEVATRAGDRLHPLTPIVNELQTIYGEIITDLNTASAAAFVNQYIDLWENRLDQTFRQHLVEHTHGHPLFTIELFNAMQEHGEIGQEKRQLIEVKAIDWRRMPVRIEGVLSQKIGRLDRSTREILEIGSVQGKLFSPEVVASVLEAEPQQIMRQLGNRFLISQRLIRPIETDSAKHTEYTFPLYRFQHDLIQQYLYESIDIGMRVYFHKGVGDALEQLTQEAPHEVSHQIAYHYEQSRADLKAVVFHNISMEREMGKLAIVNVIQIGDRVLALLDKLPESPARWKVEIEIMSKKSIAHILREGYASDQAFNANKRITKLASKLDLPHYDFQAIAGIWVYALSKGNIPEAIENALKMRDMADTSANLPWQKGAYFSVGLTYLFDGQLLIGEAAFNSLYNFFDFQIDESLSQMYGHDPGFLSIGYLAVNLWMLGYPERGRKVLESRFRVPHIDQSPYNFAFLKSLEFLYLHLDQDLKPILEQSPSIIQHAVDKKYVHLEQLTRSAYGWALAKHGDRQKGIDQLKLSIDIANRFGIHTGAASFYSMLGDCLIDTRDFDRAFSILAQAEERIPKTSRFWEPEVFRLQAKAMQATGEPFATVKEKQDQAIAAAQRQRSRMFELRARIDQARLMAANNRGQAGHDQLLACLTQFTEGIDSNRDLLEAQSVLDHLRAHLVSKSN